MLFHNFLKVFFSEKGFFANNNQNFGDLISSLLNKNKILALDVGAQGGFNSDNFLPEKYNVFFKPILVEPLKEEAEKLRKENEYVIKIIIIYRHINN